MSTLERAIAIAAEAHAKQDKRGVEPFILHVMRVVLAVKGRKTRIVAALHDIVEKSDWTLKDLKKEGFPKKVVAGVDAMSKRPEETRKAYILRLAENPIARRVKLADLEDNARVVESKRPSRARDARLRRYAKERKYLLAREKAARKAKKEAKAVKT